jgi:hypothetical protein
MRAQIQLAMTVGKETHCNHSVTVQGIILPEFTCLVRVDTHEFWLGDNTDNTMKSRGGKTCCRT